MFLAMPLGIDPITVLKPISARGSRRTGRTRRAGGTLPATTQTDQGRGNRPRKHRPSDSTHFNDSHCKVPNYTEDIPTNQRRARRITARTL